jgi:hypothetical protein
MLQSAGKFDFVDAAAQGYRFTWDKRAVLVQLAIIPFLIKTILFFVIIALDVQDNYLRSGLILLPSYAAEGWLVAQAIRLAMMLQPQYFSHRPALNASSESPVAYRRTLLAAVIIYALIKLFSAFLAGMIGTLENMSAADQPPVPVQIHPAYGFFIAAAGLAGMIWAFRYVWLYVPVAMGYSLREFLLKIRHFMLSFYMISLWLLCFIPMVLLLLVVSEVFLGVFPMISETQHSSGFTYAMVFVQSISEILIAVVSSVAMAYAVQSIMSPKTNMSI